jgi:hypothetical protein
MTILLTADQWQVALGQTLPALISKYGVHLIAQPWATKHLSKGQLRWGTTGHCREGTQLGARSLVVWMMVPRILMRRKRMAMT